MTRFVPYTILTIIVVVLSSCALPPDLSSPDTSTGAETFTLPPSAPPPTPAAVAADLATESDGSTSSSTAPGSTFSSTDATFDSLLLLAMLFDAGSGLSADLKADLFLDFNNDLFFNGTGAVDPLSPLFDLFLLNSLAPPAGSGLLDDFTFLERLCRDSTDLPNFVCRQRYGN